MLGHESSGTSHRLHAGAEAGKGLNFFIDGRKDGVPAGTLYQIDFRLDLVRQADRTTAQHCTSCVSWMDDKKTISWMPVEADTNLEAPWQRRLNHMMVQPPSAGARWAA